MLQPQLLLPGICILISGLLCLTCLVLPVVTRVVKNVRAANNKTLFHKLLLSVLMGDILNISVLMILDSLIIWASFLLESIRPIKWITLFCMGIGYWSMVLGTIMIAWNRMYTFCITLKFKPLQWFRYPKPLICSTWILSVTVTLVQSLLVCHLDFDPGTLIFYCFCPNRIYMVVLQAFGLLGLILIIIPYVFIICEIIRLKNISSQVQPVVTFNSTNRNARVRTRNIHGRRSLRSEKAEILVGLQAVLMVVILIVTNAVLAFVNFGHEILASIVSQYAMIILCTYTSVLSLIFCEDIRLGMKVLINRLLCNNNDT